MKIVNCGRGVHRREVRGVDRLRALPESWYAFTNLDLATGVGQSREIDVIIVADDRVFVIDLKDWDGRIDSENGHWKHNGRDTGPSPVQKASQNARDIYILLGNYLKQVGKGPKLLTPRVHGLVVISGNADIKGIAPTEVLNVFHVGPFIKAASTPGNRVAAFRAVPPDFVANPLTSSEWKGRLSSFFNARTGQLRPGRRRYGNFVALSDDATFEHAGGIFSEYDAEDENESKTLGMLRVWDFSKADGRFQTEEGRNEIAGREQAVIAFLTDRGERFENAILESKAYDRERGISYWEVFDRRRRLKRLADFVATESGHLSRDGRYELVRQVLARVADLHSVDAAHLDLGAHSVWLEAPSTARLSHLMSARYPQVASMGESRYRFLSAMRVPEDVLGGSDDAKRKDVFLLGVVAHHLVFGKAPAPSSDGEEIPEWSGAIDASLAHTDLHGWFEKALSLEPSARFADAAEALRAFNSATAARPSQREVAEGLESFRKDLRSQRHLFSNYPETAVVKDSDRLEVWKSGTDTDEVLVKLWKRPAWGDQDREAPRILNFLERTHELIRSPPTGCARLLRACWLGDAFCIVQEFVKGQDLSAMLLEQPEKWRLPQTGLVFVRRIAELIIDLHAGGIAHGDLKPQNVIVTGMDPCPVLVDLLDFSATIDGDITTGAYTPTTGGRMERDRYAVGKIAEEVLSLAELEPSVAADLSAAISFCREAEPANATLLPLIDALERALVPAVEDSALCIVLSIKDALTGEVLPDEGRIFIRRSQYGDSFVMRGANEEIEVWVDWEGRPWKARRRGVDQGWIGRIARFEFMSLSAVLTVSDATVNDFAGLASLFEHPEFGAGWESRREASSAGEADEPEDVSAGSDTGDAAFDALAEQMVLETSGTLTQGSTHSIDVPRLWRRLVDIEGELTTEGNAVGPSSFRREIGRHVVEFEFSSGTFDFNRADTVGVERQDRKGNWRRIGELDIPRSKPDRIVIEAPDYFGKGQRELIQDDERLRFLSHFGTQSLKRRESAISRILSRQSREPGLVDFFDPRLETVPRKLAHEIDECALALYDLNPDQVQALVALLGVRPLGLVQGPPGTGKTRFIAALAHYALTHGLARNVLLASQSHEAVNNAAEAVVKLFSLAEEQPSFLRVGNEDVVSDRLMPFHTERVERLFKHRFSAELTDRLRIAGGALGLPEELVDAVTFVETAIRPVLARIEEITATEGEANRLEGLRATIAAQIIRIGLAVSDFEGWPEEPITIPTIITKLLSRTWNGERIAAERVARFRAIARLSQDFIASVSTAQRSFETFLAGTRQIVAGTCVGLGRPSLGLTTTPFDLVIVDEAARCTASELSVPMQAGRWIVLVGDHAQLEPLHKDPQVVERVATDTGILRSEIVKSDFERAFVTPYGRACGRTLLTQYRMLPPIGRIVSNTFYNGRLKHERTAPEIDPRILPVTLSKAVTWVSTDDQGDQAFQKREKDGNSLQNSVEADAIIALLSRWHEHEPFREWIVGQTRHAQALGVICMYAAQRDLIRKRLQTSNLSEAFRRQVKVDTVDSYQGKENPVVILSLVRNNADGAQHLGAATIEDGFMSRANRVNVAASRAMDRLIVVGAIHRWPPSGPMSRLAIAFKREVHAGEAEILSSGSLIDTNQERRPRSTILERVGQE